MLFYSNEHIEKYLVQRMKLNLSTDSASMYSVFTGNHTVAALKTYEDYKNLRNGLANVTANVNKLLEYGFIVMDGKKVKLQFFLGVITK